MPTLREIDWLAEIKNTLAAESINLGDYDLTKTARFIEGSLVQGKIWADTDRHPDGNSKNNIKGAWFNLVPNADADANRAALSPTYYVIAKKVLRAEQIKWTGFT